MESELPLSPVQSVHGLLDFSRKPSMNYLGHDLADDPSFFLQNSVLSGGHAGDGSPKKFIIVRPSSGKKGMDYNTKLNVKQNGDKITIRVPYDDEGDLRFDDSRTENNNTNIERKSSRDGIKPYAKNLSGKGFLSEAKEPLSASLKKSDSKHQKSPVKKVRASVLVDRKNSEALNQSQAQPVIRKSGAGMSLVSLIAMARKMGLIKRSHAYEDIMSKEQFNMIKDLSTGRFDPKEEKRSEQMMRLKKKLLLNSDSNIRFRVHRKKTNLFDLKTNLVPSLKRMYRQFRQSISKVMAPNGVIRMLWDLYTMILIFYDLVMVPLTLAFDVPLPSEMKIWDIMMTVSFFVDIALNFDTGFYYKGMLVMDRKKIAIHYLRGWFWIDFIASFPYQYAISDPDVEEEEDNSGGGSYQIIRIVRILRFIKVLRFVRVFKLKKLFIKLESYIDMNTTITSIIGFLKLSLIILFIAHWFACAWHFISAWELESHPESWLTRHGVVDRPWIDRYVASIYWATTTMITVGYGDIIPITRNEKLLAVLAMLVASAVFAYTMNRINLILTGLDNTSEQYQKALATITDYMRKKHVKKELQIKIKKYLEYALEVETSLDSNESYLNAYLNQSLKNELLLEIHGKIMLENQIFCRFDNSLIMRVALILKEKIFSPEDPVFLEADANDDSSIYIIQTGKIEIFNFKTNSFLKTLTKGNYFGEISFFTAQARTASARSTDFSALYVIVREEFIEILNEFPLEREKFHEVKDKLSIYQDQNVINMKCYSCESTSHTVNLCPKVHVVVPVSKFIGTYLEKRNKFMTSYIRSGARGDKMVGRYDRMAEAAKRIQLKIWEGDVAIDKAFWYDGPNTDLPEFNEHPSALLSENIDRRIPAFNQHDQLKQQPTSSGEPRIQTISSLELDSGSSALNEIARTKQKITSSLHVPSLATQKERRKNAAYEDIDQVQNFVYYFPHNNFEILFPHVVERKGTIFDYFSHSDTTKDTLKRFVKILRDRVRAKKEKESSKRRRSSFFDKLIGNPAKSLFQRERNSILGSSTPPKNMVPKASMPDPKQKNTTDLPKPKQSVDLMSD